MHPDARDDDRRITYFAATHTRGKREMFGIRAIDRGKHVYVIGKTGMGKSTMLENMAIQDIQHGEGIAFIDPHGSTAEKLLDFVPHDRINDVVYFAPFDVDHPLGFNVMEDVGFEHRHLVVSGLMGAFKRIWVDAWSARMEYILQNTLLALLEYPGSTLIDVNRMLTNKTFRTAVVDKVSDPIVKAFWTEEFAAFTDTYTREATPAIQNKIGAFVSNPLIRNIIGQPTSSFDLRTIMDEKKIFIVNLSKGRMGESNASLLGSMLTVKIYLAAMSRAEEPASRMAKLPRCFFYVDEFQSMMNESFADILSESRKYKLALTLANQYIEQMDEEVRDAVFGNVGTLITFRVGPFDAETLKTVFEPTFEAEDMVGLGIGQIYLTLMIDGVGSAPFSAETIPPIEKPHISYREDVVTHSRETYGRSRAEVEAVIAAKQKEFIPPPVLSKTQIRKIEGSTYGSRPREVAPSTPPIAVTHAARTTNTPIPPVPSSTDASRPTDRSSASEVEQRSALRAAIESARKPTAPTPTPVRSPADLLRVRMQQSFSSGNNHHAPQSSSNSFRSNDFRTARPASPPRGREQPTPVSVDEPKEVGTGEVSSEILKRVISGQGGHEEDLDT
ncbi:MAG TPA: type IV secretion system DNA-binding domain-containing protein [Candidatus Paceibacterota bacterium]|nr:type IV secretion system DNA-binding domain-containing protein [Candidatus Paceibacterota bacterium]